MKWSAEREDLSLLPYLSGTEKQALRRAGIMTVGEMATLKDFAPAQADGAGRPPNELAPAPGREAQVKRLAATWPLGPRLNELVHRAKSFRRSVRRDGAAALSYIPAKGNSSLPLSTPELNPNLVRVHVDAQQDYLEGRVYLLGALVVACRDGTPAGRRAVVRMADGPPDFLTQLAAFDSPVATYLDEEVRAFKNFPMTCQSLQSLAAFLKFDWSSPHPFRQLFKARLFDYLGKIGTGPDGSGGEWYTRRSRFSSTVPLEYAYAARGQLPPPPKCRADEFADFRPGASDALTPPGRTPDPTPPPADRQCRRESPRRSPLCSTATGSGARSAEAGRRESAGWRGRTSL